MGLGFVGWVVIFIFYFGIGVFGYFGFANII